MRTSDLWTLKRRPISAKQSQHAKKVQQLTRNCNLLVFCSIFSSSLRLFRCLWSLFLWRVPISGIYTVDSTTLFLLTLSACLCPEMLIQLFFNTESVFWLQQVTFEEKLAKMSRIDSSLPCLIIVPPAQIIHIFPSANQSTPSLCLFARTVSPEPPRSMAPPTHLPATSPQ